MKISYRRVTPDFLARTRQARKILVIDLGGLGDVVHALPALWMLRQAYPQAELHCLVCAPLAGLFKRTPWIDRVWPYTGKNQSLLRQDWRMARALRAQDYAVSINLMGSNRACLIGWLSGAATRLGRKPFEARRLAWRRLNTEVMEHPFLNEPMYVQKQHCLRQAGFATPTAEFSIDANDEALRAIGIDAVDAGAYIHVSPYTTHPARELPPSQMAQLLIQLHEFFPQRRLVVSCSSDPREQHALSQLVAALPFRPWKIFPGTLDVAQLFGLIRHAALHLSGDTGSTHLAWLADTPSVSWFWRHAQLRQWAPRGALHRLVFTESPPADHLHGIRLEEILDQAQTLLDAQRHRVDAGPHAPSSNGFTDLAFEPLAIGSAP